jgi:hypothetical protein
MPTNNDLFTPFGSSEAVLYTLFLTVEAKRWRAVLKIYHSGQQNYQ